MFVEWGMRGRETPAVLGWNQRTLRMNSQLEKILLPAPSTEKDWTAQ